MSDIGEIVEVIITRENATVTQAGFGTLLILGNTEDGIGAGVRVRNYASLLAIAEDFSATDEEYLMAQKAFGGAVSPRRVAIGYQSLTSTAATSGGATGLADATIGNWTAVADGSVQVIVDSGVAQDITGLDFTLDADLDDVASTIDAQVSGAVVSHIGGNLIFLSDTTGASSAVVLSAGTGGTDILASLLTNVTSQAGVNAVNPESIPEALDAVRAIDDDWYALATVLTDDASVTASATYIQGLRKLNFARSSSAEILDPGESTDIASSLLASSFSRTALIYQADEQYASSAWAGQYLPLEPGTLTWSLKTLQGVSAVRLADSEKQSALGKQCNTYTTVGGRNVTQNGVTSNLGDYIDIIRSIDWIEARIQEAVFGRLVASLKIPYNEKGFAIIAGEVESVLNLAVGNQVINDGFIVSVPRLEDVPPQDIANRHFAGISFEAVLSGAIQSVTIRGYLV